MDNKAAFEKWWKNEYSHLESSKYTDIVPHIKYGFFQAWTASRAAIETSTTKKLIGWRMADYTEETTDHEKAKNWAMAVGVLPIFEGDVNTSLTTSHGIRIKGKTE